MSSEDFVAIDFETATESRLSACAIGICIFSEGRIHTCSYLIKPFELRFSYQNIMIHRITPLMVENAPTFPELYPVIRPFLEHAEIWAHNAPFDQGVLNALARYYNLPLPTNLQCTCRLSRRTFPQLINHKLPTVCSHLGISLNHHDAASDAEACARIVLAARGVSVV